MKSTINLACLDRENLCVFLMKARHLPLSRQTLCRMMYFFIAATISEGCETWKSVIFYGISRSADPYKLRVLIFKRNVLLMVKFLF
jgi:hypothetical protein